jgi:hypothetical protein
VFGPRPLTLISVPYSPQYFRIDRLAPQAQTPLVTLNYIPNTIASLQIPDTDERLLAAGGQDSELHLSIHSRRTSSPRNSSNTASPRPTRRLWQYNNVLSGSINNSVLLTSLSLTRSNESSAKPRVAISNNCHISSRTGRVSRVFHTDYHRDRLCSYLVLPSHARRLVDVMCRVL